MKNIKWMDKKTKEAAEEKVGYSYLSVTMVTISIRPISFILEVFGV
jgi:hypothetical protein